MTVELLQSTLATIPTAAFALEASSAAQSFGFMDDNGFALIRQGSEEAGWVLKDTSGVLHPIADPAKIDLEDRDNFKFGVYPGGNGPLILSPFTKKAKLAAGPFSKPLDSKVCEGLLRGGDRRIATGSCVAWQDPPSREENVFFGRDADVPDSFDEAVKTILLTTEMQSPTYDDDPHYSLSFVWTRNEGETCAFADVLKAVAPAECIVREFVPEPPDRLNLFLSMQSSFSIPSTYYSLLIVYGYSRLSAEMREKAFGLMNFNLRLISRRAAHVVMLVEKDLRQTLLSKAPDFHSWWRGYYIIGE